MEIYSLSFIGDAITQGMQLSGNELIGYSFGISLIMVFCYVLPLTFLFLIISFIYKLYLLFIKRLDIRRPQKMEVRNNGNYT